MQHYKKLSRWSAVLALVIVALLAAPASVQAKTVWAARYTAPGNAEDVVFKVITDQNGNIYVTGESYSASTNTAGRATPRRALSRWPSRQRMTTAVWPR